MLKRIKLLMLLQMSDKFKIKKIDNYKKLFGRIGLFSLGFVIVTALCALLLFLIHSVVFIVTPKIIIFCLVFLQFLSIIACSAGLLKTLYTSKDNSILLSYPAKHYEVFLSKLLVFYVYEAIKSIFITIPLMLAFGIIYGYFSIGYIISALIIGIILPIFPVLIGALITIPILYIKKIIELYAIVKTILMILLLVGIFALLFVVLSIIPRPLGIVEMYYSFVFGITKLIESVDYYSLFYQNIGNILLGNNVLLNYLILFAVLAVFILLIILISMPLYFKLASQSSEQSVEKKRKGINKSHKNTFFTFVKKEWLLSIRNFSDFLNNYVFLFAMPYVLFIMMTIFTSISLNSLGVYLSTVISGFVVLMMCSASNTASALAITKEGSEFVLLKTVPADSSNMVWSKIFFNLIYSSIMIVISYVIVIIFTPMFDKTSSGLEWKWLLNNDWLWLMMVMVLFVNAGLIFWSVQIDIMSPKLREYATSGDTSSMNNASKSILIGVLMALLFTVLAALLLIVGDNMIVNWTIIIGAATIFLGARLYLFILHLKHIFPYIEY